MAKSSYKKKKKELVACPKERCQYPKCNCDKDAKNTKSS